MVIYEFDQIAVHDAVRPTEFHSFQISGTDIVVDCERIKPEISGHLLDSEQFFVVIHVR